MKSSELYLKLLRWGIFASLFIPLIIFAQYLSPFHFGKMIIFRSLVEIMAVIYILLIISNKKYLPRWTPIVISFTVFTGLYVLASFTAVDFKYAFWGTLERMGGLFSFIHFWAFFIILISVFRKRADWQNLLRLSVLVGFFSILFGYGQHFKLGNFFIGWQHGGRVIGTIGNPALYAGYLLFILFLAIYLLFKIKNRSLERGFYISVLILGIPMLHLTAVRGSVFAFWASLFLLGLFCVIFPAKSWKYKKKIQSGILIALIIFLILVAVTWAGRNSSWVQGVSWLKRVTNISLQTSTLQTRLWSWKSGLDAWKEKPILGWGPENFVIAHAKHFDPRHFTNIGAETIWDRAHNMVLETLTTMGVLGCLSYLSIFFIIFFMLWRRFKEKNIDVIDMGVFGAIIIAYFVHNLFIFDTTANYLLFFLVVGYINFITIKEKNVTEKINEQADSLKEKVFKEKRPSPFLVIILIFLAVILIYKTNIEPARANYACTRAILAGRAVMHQTAFDKYKEALSYKSYQGKYEIRHRLASFIIHYNELLRQKDNKISPETLYYAIEEVEKNIQDHPMDYIPYLYIGRMYILLIPENQELAGQQAEAIIQEAIKINPRNPRAWYELGQARLSQKKYNEAIEAFQEALELNPVVPESLWFLGMTYFEAGNAQKALEYVKEAIAIGYNYYESLNDTLRLIDLYKETKEYQKMVGAYKNAIKLQPKHAQFYASLAATYRILGDFENAIFYARQAGEIDESFKEEAELFIQILMEERAMNNEQ